MVTFAKDVVDREALRMFEECERDVEPARGWVVIRVLPREQISTSGKIILTEKQNKVLLEAVVLRVFKPYWKAAESLIGRERYREIAEMRDGMALIVSQVNPGDHVLFPHFEGLPVGQVLDENRYRLIEEMMVSSKLNYHQRGWRKKQLIKVADKAVGKSKRNRKIVEALMEQADIMPLSGYFSKTTSGA